MRKAFKALLPILLVISLIFTLGVDSVNMDNLITENEVERDEEAKDPPKEEMEEKLKEESKEEIREEVKEEPQGLEEQPEEKPEEEPKIDLKEKPKEEEKKDLKEGPKDDSGDKKIPEEDELIEEENIVELAENYPDMLGEPRLVFPNINYRNMRTNSAISDTIEVDKTAKRTVDEEGNKTGCRTFEVTLDITGTPQEAPVDVVLVIDRSGSMKDGNVIEYVAITSAPSTNKSYYVKVGGSYQSVSYSSGGWFSPPQGWYYGSGSSRRYVTWDANGDDNAPGGNSNNPVGKPFYERHGRSRMYLAKQAAVNFAAKVLGANGVAGSRVSIVSYSGPTTTSGSGSYGIQGHASKDQDLTSDISLVNGAINGLEADGGTNTEAGFIEAKNVIQDDVSNENPNSSKVVIMFTDGMPTSSIGNAYGPNDPTDHNNHTIAAYTAGQDIYNNGIADVFTVGLFEGMTGAVYNLAVNTLTRAQNKGFYDAPTAAALDGIFNDISTQLGYAATQAKVVDKIGDSFNLIESSLPAGATYDAATREITWNPGTIYSSAQLKYIVQAKPDFPAGWADTNEYATLTYKDIFGVGGKHPDPGFPKPKVNVPTLLEVSLTDASIIKGESISLGTGTDLNGGNYMDISGGDGNGSYTYEWKLGDEVLTGDNPTVSPTETTTYNLKVIDSNGCIAKSTMKVIVTERKTTIGIKKIAKGSNGLLDGAEFELKKGEEIIATEATAGGYTWANDLLPGGYTLKETKAPIGYELNTQVYTITMEMDGNITTSPNLTIVTEDGKQVIVIENDLLKFNIGLKKIDKKTGALLDGAKFKWTKDGVETEINVVDGYMDLDNLLAGTYTLKETKAPTTEYRLDGTEYEIVIGATGDVTVIPDNKNISIEDTEEGKKVIVVKNTKKVPLPSTGGPGSLIFILLGISLMAGSYIGSRKNKGGIKMKMNKRFLSLIIALVMVVSMVGPMMAFAEGNPTVGETGSLTIHKLYFDGAVGGKIDGTGESATELPTGALALEGAKFKVWKVADDAVLEGFTAPSSGGTELETNEHGETVFSGLELGRYYVEETFLPHGVTTGSEPFMVDIPTTSTDGTRLINDVHVYPKNVLVLGAAQLAKLAEDDETGLAGAEFSLFKRGTTEDDVLIAENITTETYGLTPIIENLVAGDYYFQETTAPEGYLLDARNVEFTVEAGNHAYVDGELQIGKVIEARLVNFAKPVAPVKEVDKSTADIGEDVTWTITATLPANIEDYESYSITDVLDSRLDFVNLDIKLDGTALAATAYTLTEDPTGTHKIVFTPAQLAQGTLTVTIKTKINNTAALGTEIPNKARIDYDNGYVEEYEETNEVTVETGGYNFIKVIKGTETGLKDAEFKVRRADNMYLKQDATTKEITWVVEDQATIFKSGEDGKFSVNGLAYGDYFLEEIKAPPKYSKLQSAIPFTVSDISHSANPQPIENKERPKMPQTGGMGTILFTALGLGLMGIAAKAYKKEEK